jgi:hypothetical protein
VLQLAGAVRLAGLVVDGRPLFTHSATYQPVLPETNSRGGLWAVPAAIVVNQTYSWSGTAEHLSMMLTSTLRDLSVTHVIFKTLWWMKDARNGAGQGEH